MSEARGDSRHLLWEITRWELLRWLKLKDQLSALGFSIAIGLLVWGGLALFERHNRETVRVVVFDSQVLPFALGEDSNSEDSDIELEEPAGRSVEEVFQALERREIDAVLRLLTLDGAELVVAREPLWKAELENALAAARRERKLEASGLDPAVLSDLFAPVELSVVYHESAGRVSSLADKVAAGILIGLMLMAVLISFSYQFIAITGEKQLRVTELIVSSVGAQTWIDGKILGVSLLALISTGTYLLSALIFVLLSQLFGHDIEIPLVITDPWLWLWLVLLALGGLLLWNTFFGLIAATIDDPNTSSRTGLMILPLLPLAFAFLGLTKPDTTLMQILGVLPFTSPTVLALRLVLTEVAWWEIPVALALLAVTTWMLRKAAGKVFGLAILMYGKEPSWREMARCIRGVT